jgi:hypothetical protein
VRSAGGQHARGGAARDRLDSQMTVASVIIVVLAVIYAYWRLLFMTADLIGYARARSARKAHGHPGTHNPRSNGGERSGERSH